MRPLSIVVLLLVILAGVWFVAKEKKAMKQSSSLTTQGSETTSEPTSTNISPGAGATVSQGMTLTVTSPANGATVTSTRLTIQGKTKAGADVFINDLETKADAGGNFSVTLTLDQGDNPIVVSANDADGNVAEKELTVYYESGQ